MATILLSAVGFSAGASIGGAVLGLSGAVIGRAVGATIGRVIDQRLLGSGAQAVETGKIDRFRITGASQGTPVPQIFGRLRVGGQVIWASRFLETTTTTGGGKGTSRTPKTTAYSYSVSIAVALCQGEISRVGRVWADGVEIARDDLNLREYSGSQTQMPDPKISAIEGADKAPAYRGIAYVVIEDLDLAKFGNRIPQFNFEVLRPAQSEDEFDIAHAVQGVAMIPGTGEYALATTPVHYAQGLGINRSANINSPSGKTDFLTSTEDLIEELPNLKSGSLVVSWFGDDLRCDQISIQPKVEQTNVDGAGMAWGVSGVNRTTAQTIPTVDGKTIYGGTPTDQSVIEAIEHLKSKGKEVVFYPFILMDQVQGNTLIDPYSGATGQPILPWRGRITLSVAPQAAGSPDGTAFAQTEVDSFFGSAASSDFTATGNGVSYSGPNEWSYRRFILHYAHICALAGGVDAFLIGSEMRGLTQIRGAGGSFPAVQALIQLAADVRSILGAGTKISYAADWTEYSGYQPTDGSGDKLFHLDPFWSDINVDFIGIDNYMPMSDWREGDTHLDAQQGSIYNLEYLKSNILGGEGYDYYYHSPESRAAQIRTQITDGAYNEPWIYRYKDIKNWWLNPHHDRISGVRHPIATPWVPGSKPVWFTEIGCAAVDKGTNQPNKFIDPKSSESSLPNYSTGAKDELIQMQYLRALYSFWDDDTNNPTDATSGHQMIDLSHAHVWAWDTRPFPAFPGNAALWSDSANYTRGHWINGRTAARSLASVVKEICNIAGVVRIDVSNLHGFVRGYKTDTTDTARSALQPLMLAYGFDAIERDGMLVFKNRTGKKTAAIASDTLAVLDGQNGRVQSTRTPESESVNRVRLNYIDSENNYEIASVEAAQPGEKSSVVSQSEVSLALSKGEARNIVERWLAESRIAKDSVQFALPPSSLEIGAGDVVRLPTSHGNGLYRVDHVELSGAKRLEAIRVEEDIYKNRDTADAEISVRPFTPAVPLFPVFLDLPLIRGDESPIAPYIAISAKPWPDTAAVFSASTDSGYGLNKIISAASIIGKTKVSMPYAPPALFDRGAPLRVKIASGTLESKTVEEILNGANLAAIGDGSSDNWEIFQFVNAEIVGENTYDLSLRLRGQLGTDAITSGSWPSDSYFVLLNGVPEQINLLESERNLARHYRIGPAARDYSDPSYNHRVDAFKGNGLRPYAPCHLTISGSAGADIDVNWIRRTRLDGDTWEAIEVPLGETNETYVVRVMNGANIVRETLVSSPNWTYSSADQIADAISVPFAIHVAQVSDSFGFGLFSTAQVLI